MIYSVAVVIKESLPRPVMHIKNIAGRNLIYLESSRVWKWNFKQWNGKYGKIRFKYRSGNKIQVPRYPATVENYPYTARGFTASRNVVLPEWELTENCIFEEGDIFEVYDRSGKIIEKYEFKGKGWMLR